MATTKQQKPTGRRTPKKKTVSNRSKGKTSSLRTGTAVKKTRKVKKASSNSGLLGNMPLSAVIYGPSGVGKTSLVAHLPDVGFFYDPQERGIITLTKHKQCPEPVFKTEITDFEMLISEVESLAADTRGIKTLVGDSLTGFEQICFAYHCEEYFEGDWSSKGFYSFSQGPKNAAKTDWPRLLTALNELMEAGVNIILLGHSEIRTFNNPEGPDYDQFVPCMDKKTWAITHRWAEAVFFYNYFVSVEKKGPRSEVDFETEARLLYSVWSPAYTAKNQLGLDPVIDAGDCPEVAAENFLKAFAKVTN